MYVIWLYCQWLWTHQGLKGLFMCRIGLFQHCHSQSITNIPEKGFSRLRSLEGSCNVHTLCMVMTLMCQHYYHHHCLQKMTAGLVNHMWKVTNNSHPDDVILFRIFDSNANYFDRGTEYKIICALHRDNVIMPMYCSYAGTSSGNTEQSLNKKHCF